MEMKRWRSGKARGSFWRKRWRAALRATLGITVLVWAVFGLWLSYQIVRHLVSFLLHDRRHQGSG